MKKRVRTKNLYVMKNNLLSEKLVFNGDSVAPTRLRLCSYDANEVNVWEGCSADELEAHLTPKHINWLQIYGFGDTETIRRICTFFGIDFLVMQDIFNSEHPSKVEEHDTYNLIIAKQITEDDVLHIGIVQGDMFVLTFQERSNGFFDDIVQAIRNNALKFRSRQSDYLLTVLLNSIAANYMSVVRSIGDDLDDLESELLSSTADRDIGVQIQTLRRRYMVLKRAATPLREQYQRILLRSDSPLIHKANRVFLNDVNDHLSNVAQSVDICRETLSSLMDLYISNNDLRMNDIMKRLTIVSTIFIPLTFLAGVWGMNFKYMPELEWRYGYAAAWAVMIVVGVVVYLFFQSKKWR